MKEKRGTVLSIGAMARKQLAEYGREIDLITRLPVSFGRFAGTGCNECRFTGRCERRIVGSFLDPGLDYGQDARAGGCVIPFAGCKSKPQPAAGPQRWAQITIDRIVGTRMVSAARRYNRLDSFERGRTRPANFFGNEIFSPR